VGIGTSAPGYLAHVKTPTAANAYVNVWERTSGAKVGMWMDTAKAQLETMGAYDLKFDVNGGSSGGVFIDKDNGNVGIGTTAPASLLSLDQGAGDDAILNCASSDVAHGVTTLLPTDSYLSISKYSATEGGVFLKSASEGERGIINYAVVSSCEGASQAADKVAHQSWAAVKSGTGITNMTANGTSWSHRVRRGGSWMTVACIDEDGDLHMDGATSITGYDYAEFFEWKDGNPDNEDRVGYSVALDGDKIKKAEEGETPIGIISAKPGVIGDNPMGWHGQWKRDEWGRSIHREADWVKWEYDFEAGDKYKEGDVIPEDKNIGDIKESRILKKKEQWKVEDLPEDLEVPANAVYYKVPESQYSDEYDESKPYLMRGKRQEWDAVGLMGKLRMRSGQPTASSWIKMRDEGNGIEMWLIK
jgi:hypothetical protein